MININLKKFNLLFVVFIIFYIKQVNLEYFERLFYKYQNTQYLSQKLIILSKLKQKLLIFILRILFKILYFYY